MRIQQKFPPGGAGGQATAPRPGSAQPGVMRPGTTRPSGAAQQRPAVRLTARGGILLVFALSFAGTLAGDGLHTGALTGICYVAACALAASTVRRTQLLSVAATPPALFCGALVCAEIITARGGALSIAEGTLVTLGNVAPWLFAGTALAIITALARGLATNVRTLRHDLRGDPAEPHPPRGRAA